MGKKKRKAKSLGYPAAEKKSPKIIKEAKKLHANNSILDEQQSNTLKEVETEETRLKTHEAKVPWSRQNQNVRIHALADARVHTYTRLFRLMFFDIFLVQSVRRHDPF